jgi:hypothetical protein
MEIAQGGLSPGARELYAALRRPSRSDFTAPDLVAEGLGSKSSVATRLSELVACDVIEQTEPARGKMPARWKLGNPKHLPTPGGIPTVEQIADRLANARRNQDC